MTQEGIRARIVYLDTSHQHSLALLAAKEPTIFDEFVAWWGEAACTLAVTRLHLLEMRQHGDAKVRQGRLTLFELLAPVVSDVPNTQEASPGPSSLQEREALRALITSGRVGAGNAEGADRLVRWMEIFPGRYERPASVRELSVMEHPSFDKITAIMRAALETAALARTRPDGAPYERPRLRDLPDEPLSPEKIAEAQRMAREAAANVPMWEKLRGVLPDDDPCAGLSTVAGELSKESCHHHDC